jgi:hypothetical protein
MRAAFRSPHEPVTDHEGEARAGIASVQVALDNLPDDRLEMAIVLSNRASYSTTNRSK